MSGGDESVLMRAFLDQWSTDEYRQWLSEYLNKKGLNSDMIDNHYSDSPAPWQAPSGFARPITRIELDPKDPFECVLIDIVDTNRRKRKDYAADGDPFSNFTLTSELLGLDGFDAVESALFNVCQKLARLKALRMNGRMDNPENESVADTYLDLAVYAVITYAIYRQAIHTAAQTDEQTPDLLGLRADSYREDGPHWGGRTDGPHH